MNTWMTWPAKEVPIQMSWSDGIFSFHNYALVDCPHMWAIQFSPRNGPTIWRPFFTPKWWVVV